MRNTSLIPALFPGDDTSRDTGLQFKRRDFLRTLGIAGVAGAAIALTPNIAPAKPILTASQWEKSCDDWLECMTALVLAIYDGNSRGDRIIEKLSNSKLSANSGLDSSNIHDRYSARHVFRVEIDYDEVICTNGFMVKRFPFYGLTCGCPVEKDLNGPEISRITSPSAISKFNCVLAPNGYRQKLADHANYRANIRRSKNHDPSDWNPAYVREFVKKKTGEKYPVYGLEHKTEADDFGDPNADVIIGSYNV